MDTQHHDILSPVLGATAVSFGITAETLLGYLQFGFAVFCFLWSLIFPVVKKVIEAKKNDGKIDADEAVDILDTANDSVNKIKDKINEKDGK